MKKFVIGIIMFALSSNAFAIYDKSKLTDWKWHAHVCKNVAINLKIIAEMEAKNGAKQIDAQEKNLKKMIAKSVFEREKEFNIDQQDAMFIADLTFSARKGIIESGGQLTYSSAMNQGFNICTYILDQFDKDLSNKTK